MLSTPTGSRGVAGAPKGALRGVPPLGPAIGQTRGPILAGVGAGGLAVVVALTGLAMADREVRWPVGFLALVAYGAALAIVSDKRRFLLASLLVAISIRTTVNLWMPPDPQFLVSSGTTTTAVEMLAMDLPLVGLVLVLWGTKVPTRLAMDGGDVLAALFLLFTAVSAVQAEDRSLSLCRLPVVARMPLIYYCFSRGVRSVGDVRLCVLVLAICGVGQSSLALAQTAGASFSMVGPLVERDEQVSEQVVGGREYVRATGTVGYTTVLAQYLGAILPMTVLPIFMGRTGVRRTLAFGGCCVVIAAIVLSLSRTEWIITPLSLIAMVLLGARAGYRLRRPSRGLLTRVLAILLATVIVTAALWPTIDARMTGPDDDSAASRIPLARVAVAVIAAHPLWGVGLNNYTRDMYAHGSQDIPPGFPFGVHNAFLYMAAESGIVSLAAFIAMLALAFRRLLTIGRTGQGSLAAPAVAFLCGLAALTAHSMVEEGFHVHQVLAAVLWAYLGVSRALLILQRRETAAAPASPAMHGIGMGA